MFWGTDIARMLCSWRKCVTLFTEELPWLKGRDLEFVMGAALCNWHRAYLQALFTPICSITEGGSRRPP
jgi:hypothetical protein